MQKIILLFRWIDKQKGDIAIVVNLEGDYPNLTTIPVLEEPFKALVKNNVLKAAKNIQNVEEGEICHEVGELRSDELHQEEG